MADVHFLPHPLEQHLLLPEQSLSWLQLSLHCPPLEDWATGQNPGLTGTSAQRHISHPNWSLTKPNSQYIRHITGLQAVKNHIGASLILCICTETSIAMLLRQKFWRYAQCHRGCIVISFCYRHHCTHTSRVQFKEPSKFSSIARQVAEKITQCNRAVTYVSLTALLYTTISKMLSKKIGHYKTVIIIEIQLFQKGCPSR